jgi:hypothetical protein
VTITPAGSDLTPDAEPSLTLHQLAWSPCGAGSCPTVFATDRDTIVVQGYAVAPSTAGVTIPEGELLVEIPRWLLLNSVEALHGES